MVMRDLWHLGFARLVRQRAPPGFLVRPEQRLADLSPEQRLLAMPDDALRALPDDYLRSLPPEVQDALRKRIGRPNA
jgi:hypothetical protein